MIRVALLLSLTLLQARLWLAQHRGLRPLLGRLLELRLPDGRLVRRRRRGCLGLGGVAGGNQSEKAGASCDLLSTTNEAPTAGA